MHHPIVKLAGALGTAFAARLAPGAPRRHSTSRAALDRRTLADIGIEPGTILALAPELGADRSRILIETQCP